ncbi:metal-dependent hydrolase [bacterium]|nr:metal-dependent hydrolase [bacterium]
MRFNSHLAGGIGAGLVCAFTAELFNYTSVSTDMVADLISNPFSPNKDIIILSGVFFIAVFMALFPDLDSASVLQRWFYRLVFLCLVVLFIGDQMGLFAAITFISLLPVLHKHRGWTHSPVTPFILAVFIIIIVELQASSTRWFNGFSLQDIWESAKNNWIYIFACVLGHYSHLALDKRL